MLAVLFGLPFVIFLPLGLPFVIFLPQWTSGKDRDLPHHVWVELAVIFKTASGLDGDAFLLPGRNYQIPFSHSGARSVCDEVAVQPLDGIADADGYLRRRISHPVHCDLNYFAARRIRSGHKNKRTEAPADRARQIASTT